MTSSVFLKNSYRRSSRSPILVCAGFAIAGALSFGAPLRASTLTASDGAEADSFGISVSVSVDRALTGAYGDDDHGNFSGSAYYFKGLDGKSGTVTEDVKLLASDGAEGEQFGHSVSLFGDRALVGAFGDDGDGYHFGSAYYFKGLDGKSGTVTEDVKLLASDGAEYASFGTSVSLFGDRALAGTYGVAAYYFKGLDGKSGTVTEDLKLLASDGAESDRYGSSVSLSEDRALVGANANDTNGLLSGSAYYFKGMDGKSGAVTEDVKLLASDGAEYDYFGYSVSLSGDRALVGAFGDTEQGVSSGSAYYFKGLDGQSDTVTENVKLLASDGGTNDYFGTSVSLSGDRALAGAYGDDEKGSTSGSVYYFQGLDGKSGTVTEDVKVFASDGAAGDNFGYSVSLDGDHFVVGAHLGDSNTGKAYAGDVRAFTTLDAGGSDLSTDGLSFVSRGDWVVGGTTDGNRVTLSRDAATGIADTADVTAADAAVYIGRAAGADNNSLAVEGELTANAVHIGAEGNSGNALALATTGAVLADTIFLAEDNFLAFELGASGVNGFVDAGEITLGGTLVLSASGDFAAVEGAEYHLFGFGSLAGTFSAIEDGGILGLDYRWDTSRLYTEGIIVTAIPEPSTYALAAGLAGLLGALVRHRRLNR